MEENKFKKDLNKFKKKLIKKVKEKGIYENFGQNEIRDLKDKYNYDDLCKNNLCLTKEQIKTRELIIKFENWCLNYNGE